MKSAPKLNQFLATAVAGNNILSSVLYVSGIAILFAGVYAPLVLLAVVVLLALYKAIYTEVVEALPINGGVYNCLLNGTQKIVAALAGALALLAYLATAVISAKVGVEYLATLLPIPVLPSVILLLGIVAALVLLGITNSARVAGGIFLFHLVSLGVFISAGIFALVEGGSVFADNGLRTLNLVNDAGGLPRALFFAFSASLLGVSGFESSANFVEEQAPGVFRKTLRNMLIGVGVVNPLIALIVLHALPLGEIASAKDFLLADAGRSVGGNAMALLIIIDAFLVLSGAALTAFIGVTGLSSRMARDGCLPRLILRRNRRGAYPWTVAGFFALGVSVLLLTRGNLLSLAGVYTISFLSVMSLFALGNLILKKTRPELKRTYRAPTLVALLAGTATVAGIAGNLALSRDNLVNFSVYFLPAAAAVAIAVYADYLLRFALRFAPRKSSLHKYLRRDFEDITHGKYVIFVNHADKLYPMLRYINRNETGRQVTSVHCSEAKAGRHDSRCKSIERAGREMQKAGVLPHLSLSYACVHQPFGQDTILKVARQLRVRPNRVFIGSIHSFHPFDYADLHGARIIF